MANQTGTYSDIFLIICTTRWRTGLSIVNGLLQPGNDYTVTQEVCKCFMSANFPYDICSSVRRYTWPTNSENYVYLFSFSHAQAQCEGNSCVAAVAGPHLGVRVYGGGQEYHLFPLYFRHRKLVAGIILFQILFMPLCIKVCKPPDSFFPKHLRIQRKTQ